jgi:hypothetical protein
VRLRSWLRHWHESLGPYTNEELLRPPARHPACIFIIKSNGERQDRQPGKEIAKIAALTSRQQFAYGALPLTCEKLSVKAERDVMRHFRLGYLCERDSIKNEHERVPFIRL